VSAREYQREGRISRFSLDRRITVLVLFMTLLVVGVVATSGIPVELIPSGYNEPFLQVRVPWEDAPSREVMDKLTVPLEDELSTVKGIDQVVSISVTGNTFVYMWFKHGTDMNVAYREVRDRVERARRVFPDDIDRVFIRKDDAAGIPVFMLGLAIDPTLTDSYNLIQNEIVLPLSRVDGVASVETQGLVEKEILIELDREKTRAAGLNIYELAQDLGSDNFTMASGTVRDGDRKLMLRSVARFDDLEQLRNRLVGRNTRLGDIAVISYDQPESDFRVRAMSRPAVAIGVLKEGEANVREVSMRVAATVERLQQNPRLASIQMMTLFSQGDVIDEALLTLLSSGAIGGILAAMVLFLFLRRFRLTLIIALGIPLSLLIGLTVMYFSGESLNLLTLLGLMLCVGLLVDNSVVVAENIHRLHREGMDRRQACIHGAGEVGLAITMSTLTTIVVFLPVALVDGPGQFFLLRLAIPVCVSVAASLLVALVFIPLCVYLTLNDGGNGRRAGWMRRVHDRVNTLLRWVYDSTFERLNVFYGRCLAVFLRRRLELVLLLIAVFGVTLAVPMKAVKFVEVQEEERHGFYIGVEMPSSTTLEEAEEWFLAAEKVIESKKDELGLEGWFMFHRATRGELQGWFSRPHTADVTPSEATKIVKDALPVKPGMTLTTGNDRDVGDDKGNSAWTAVLRGEDPDLLEETGAELEKLFVQVPGVLGSKGNNQQMPNELALVVDRERAQQYGVNPEVVAGMVGYALRGSALPKYHKDGKEIPVRVRFLEKDRESLTELQDFSVPTESGSLLPLSALTDTEFLPAPRAIVRRNKEMGRVVSLELEQGKEEETRERLALLTAAIDLPEGVSFGSTGSLQDLDEDLAAMRMAALLSVVFIYLLMGFLFESFILPLSIILTIPLSIIGVHWTHFVSGYDIDFLGVVAIVLLIGVVVNNGIVLIDYVNRLRTQGQERGAAILLATQRRFRPIMMTAITTIGGMVPLALAGANSIGLSYTSFALTLIGGMSTATLLTLLVVPIFYTLFDDARAALTRSVLRGWMRVRWSGGAAAAAEQRP
jgi:HAE1 family hydrophobic/amphiphilic exporter-1